MHEVRIVNSIAEINREQLKDGKENSQQEIKEFVHERVKKYEEKEKEEAYGNICRRALGQQEKSYWELKMERRKKLQEHYEKMQEKKIVARKIRQEQCFNKLAQQKSDRQYLSQPCTEEGQLFQFSVAELIFGEGGIL